MKKKELLIIFLLGVLALGGGLIVLVKNRVPGKRAPLAVINGEKYKDYHLCAQKDPIAKYHCYRLSAIANNDPTICANIEDPSTTQYLRNNCILIAEAINLSVLPLICEGLNEDSCVNQEGCRPVHVVPTVKDSTKSVYHQCDIDSHYFCQQSGGLLDSRYECICPAEKAEIKPYGCFDCNNFSNNVARSECLKTAGGK